MRARVSTTMTEPTNRGKRRKRAHAALSTRILATGASAARDVRDRHGPRGHRAADRPGEPRDHGGDHSVDPGRSRSPAGSPPRRARSHNPALPTPGRPGICSPRRDAERGRGWRYECRGHAELRRARRSQTVGLPGPGPSAPAPPPAVAAAPAPAPTAAPAPAPAAAPAPPPRAPVAADACSTALDPRTWWFVARASGLVAWGLLALAVIWGLALSTKTFGRNPKPAWLLDLHRHLGGLAVVFTGVHLVGLVADNYVALRMARAVRPARVDVEAGSGRVGNRRLLRADRGRDHVPAPASAPSRVVAPGPHLSFPLFVVATGTSRDRGHRRWREAHPVDGGCREHDRRVPRRGPARSHAARPHSTEVARDRREPDLRPSGPQLASPPRCPLTKGDARPEPPRGSGRSAGTRGAPRRDRRPSRRSRR